MAHEMSASRADGRASRHVIAERRGFTLIELLVVIGIIAALCGLLMPVLAKVRETSRRSKCMSNMHQIGCALTMYADDHDSFLYPAVYNEGWKAPMGRYPQGSAWPFAMSAYVRHADVDAGFTNIEARMDFIDNGADRRPKCADCDISDACSGGCPATNLHLKGSLFSPSALECFNKRLYRELLARIPKEMKGPGA